MSKALKVLLFWVILSLSGVGALSAQNSARDQNLDSALRKVINENFDAYEKEDLDRVLATVHTKSFGYQSTKQATIEIFSAYDLHYELLESRLLSLDGEYAVVRARQKTTKRNGPEFRDNILDTVMVFKQEDGRWKFWTQAILDVQFLN